MDTQKALERFEQYRKENLASWASIITSIFPSEVPQSATWSSLPEILHVLDEIGRRPESNHTLMPDGGGLDLTGVEVGDAPETLRLVYGERRDIVKPSKLYFESFGEDLSWAYFRLEVAHLDRIVQDDTGEEIENTGNDIRQYVVDLGDGRFIDSAYWDFDNYHGKRLPKNACRIAIYFKGAFLFVAKTSIYNRDASTYDARHNKFSAPVFRKYIEHQIELLKLAQEQEASSD